MIRICSEAWYNHLLSPALKKKKISYTLAASDVQLFNSSSKDSICSRCMHQGRAKVSHAYRKVALVKVQVSLDPTAIVV